MQARLHLNYIPVVDAGTYITHAKIIPIQFFGFYLCTNIFVNGQIK